jgi:hypothetical protein
MIYPKQYRAATCRLKRAMRLLRIIVESEVSLVLERDVGQEQKANNISGARAGPQSNFPAAYFSAEMLAKNIFRTAG